jgi:hypothetical protein
MSTVPLPNNSRSFLFHIEAGSRLINQLVLHKEIFPVLYDAHIKHIICSVRIMTSVLKLKACGTNDYFVASKGREDLREANAVRFS